MHDSDCGLLSLPASMPMPCDCSARDALKSASSSYRNGYNLSARLRMFGQLWLYRSYHLRENLGSLRHYRLKVAKRLGLSGFWYRILAGEAPQS